MVSILTDTTFDHTMDLNFYFLDMDADSKRTFVIMVWDLFTHISRTAHWHTGQT